MAGVTPIDIAGQRFGKLTVLHRVKGRDGARWMCRCDCGAEKSILSRSLRITGTSSCGCIAGGKPRHGEHSSKLYGVWAGMLARCRNPNHASYRTYGGKGVAVCAEWQAYEAFRDWALANGHAPGLSIDRRDSNGDYCPENCRWATQREQMRNQSRNRKAPDGELWLDIAERNGICCGTFRWRLRRGWSIDRAATQPIEVHTRKEESL